MSSLFDRPFDELAPGERFRTRGRTISEADIVAFAGLTGDFHPQHVDAVWSRASPFGERIAHGLLVVSAGVGLIPFSPERVVALRRVRDAVFKRPVPIGATIHADGAIRDLTALDGATGLVSIAVAVAADGRTAVRATVDVLWARTARPAPVDADAPLADPLTCVPL